MSRDISRRVDKFNPYDWTKKEKVVYLAKRDPFLKVEKIAQLAETSSHYVRTVLSEANLSLTRLRKEYAQGSDTEVDERNGLLLDILDIKQLNNLTVELETDEAILNNIDKYNKLKENNNYQLAKTRLFQLKDDVSLINSNLIVTKEAYDSLSKLKEKSNAHFSKIRCSSVLSQKKITRLLNIKENSPIIVIWKEIFINQKLCGVDMIYCDFSKFQLVLDPISYQGIKLEVKSDY
ncbi:hypothetical protein Halha_0440 [Halobacteroides halobius DSM 5150]|uniref:Uncharacterized protein n=1 Tax=Halobacteroides halobius (strain ATCC 35273 / DSM 5150 / MD-1) TaxID=748449 RepID=L0K8I5_HALHC|nr:hypothetical protein [Halobacteroides halobius]AGB40433.1 hypothetical protein Halha_0440 [Halobacteroides halobius DSM 5150]